MGLERSTCAKYGMAYVARAIGSRSPRSSQGQGKPATRRRGTGESKFKTLVGNSVMLLFLKVSRTGQRTLISRFTGEPCAVKVASTVRGGAVGKVPVMVTRWPPTLR